MCYSNFGNGIRNTTVGVKGLNYFKLRGCTYTAGGFVWCDRPFYLEKKPQEKWTCDNHDDAPPLSFKLQVAEVIF